MASFLYVYFNSDIQICMVQTLKEFFPRFLEFLFSLIVFILYRKISLKFDILLGSWSLSSFSVLLFSLPVCLLLFLPPLFFSTPHPLDSSKLLPQQSLCIIRCPNWGSKEKDFSGTLWFIKLKEPLFCSCSRCCLDVVCRWQLKITLLIFSSVLYSLACLVPHY